MKFEKTSNFGRFLSTKYSLKVGDNDIASKIISKSKNLQSDLVLAELNFNSYLINGDFNKAKEFKDDYINADIIKTIDDVISILELDLDRVFKIF